MKFLATYGILIVGVILNCLGAPLIVLIFGLFVTTIAIIFGMIVNALATMPSKAEEDAKISLNSESKEYLSKYMPKN